MDSKMSPNKPPGNTSGASYLSLLKGKSLKAWFGLSLCSPHLTQTPTSRHNSSCPVSLQRWPALGWQHPRTTQGNVQVPPGANTPEDPPCSKGSRNRFYTLPISTSFIFHKAVTPKLTSRKLWGVALFRDSHCAACPQKKGRTRWGLGLVQPCPFALTSPTLFSQEQNFILDQVSQHKKLTQARGWTREQFLNEFTSTKISVSARYDTN